ncbi:prophage regulatory protein [Pararobbsia alpina]|uniref:helix-turn-helix transcriptional regulator n=1 Tax=Pararobbsia alpina TaxID=621374 RepID=UPI0039A5F8D2
MNALGIKQVTAKVSLGKTTIYRMISTGDFPKPFPITENRVAWVESEVDEWLEARVSAARHGEKVDCG